MLYFCSTYRHTKDITLTLKKTLVALAILGSLALAGCSATAPVATAKTTSAATKADQPCPKATATSYGDVIPKEVITDKYGKYCHTTVNPNATVLQWDATKINIQSMDTNGVSKEEMQQAQKAVVTYVTEQALDSTKLDNSTQPNEEWINQNSSYFADPNIWLKSFKDGKNLSTTGLLVTGRFPEPIIRNGQPRANKTTLTMNQAYAFSDAQGTKYVTVIIDATAEYTVRNDKIVKMYLGDDPTNTQEHLKAEAPKLFTPGSTNLILQGTFGYAILMDASHKIFGSKDNWTINTSDGIQIIK